MIANPTLMKHLRIPILFSIAAVVFSLISIISCQTPAAEPAEDDAVQISEMNQEEVTPENEKFAENTSVNMRFGPR